MQILVGAASSHGVDKDVLSLHTPAKSSCLDLALAHTGSEPHPTFSTVEVLRPLFMVVLSHFQLIECDRSVTVLLLLR